MVEMSEPMDFIVKGVGEENASINEMDLICYTRDLAPLPDSIISIFAAKVPSVVVRPKNADQVSTVLQYANKERMPVTPRGGGCSGMGGCLPVDGGIVLDMTSLNSIVSIDEDDMTITTQVGVTFQKLLEKAGKKNLKIGTYPTSAPSATIGGYISNGGHAGIGSPKYGSIASQIQQLEVVLPTGEKEVIRGPYSDIFVGAEGTLGIITEVVLRAYQTPEAFSVISYGFDDVATAFKGLKKMLRSDVKPNSLTFMDRSFLEITSKLGLNVPQTEMVFIITLEGKKQLVAEGEAKLNQIFSDGKSLDPSFALEEWDRRYKSELFIKRSGPTMILVEVSIPIVKLGESIAYLKNLSRKLDLNITFYGIMGDRGSMLTLPLILTDERIEENFLDVLIKSLKMMTTVINMGGKIYTVGLYGSMFLKYIHGEKKLELMKNLKKELDPNGIMNPGKFTESRISWLAPILMT
jgi:glycolate oxidase